VRSGSTPPFSSLLSHQLYQSHVLLRGESSTLYNALEVFEVSGVLVLDLLGPVGTLFNGTNTRQTSE
jgi:hypothetical protein